MNQLSWLIYGADVLKNINEIVGVFSFLSFFAAVMLGTATLILRINAGPHWEDKENSDFLMYGSIKSIVNRAVPLFCLLWVVGVVLPDSDTVYLIAASEIGEEVIQTEEFNKLRIILNDKLDNILHEDDRQASDE